MNLLIVVDQENNVFLAPDETSEERVDSLCPDDTRPAGWWTSEDGRGQMNMTGKTVGEAIVELLSQCGDNEAERAGILAGTLEVL